jgi:1-deoxy-D-xylulose-5-phosphate reductoisomerase
MGKKVSIDSATLVNKGLELIEAHWLFGLSADQLDAVIHPQSTIHALVETNDASILAHLGPTDMRCPIQHALTHPNRAPAQAPSLDLATLGSLDFEPIDPARFPAINLAKRVIKQADSAGVVFNAANEAAVEAFLNNQINFGAITQIIERTLDQYTHHPIDTLDSVLQAHGRAMSIASDHITHAAV